MSKLFNVILATLLLSLLMPLDVYGLNYTTDASSFSVVTYTTTSIFDQGDEVVLQILITGYGGVKQNKMKVLVPPYIVEGHLTLNRIDFQYNPGMNCYDPLGYREPFEGPHNIVFNISLWKFSEEPCPVKGRVGGLSILSEGTYGPTQDQVGGPFEIRFRIPEEAPNGDHFIESIFTYNTGSQWATTKSTTRIHIRSYWEKNEKFFTILFSVVSIILALSAVVIACAQFNKK